MYRTFLAICLGGGLLAASAPAFGQGFTGNQYGKGGDPNLGHFYMGRQQIQITDDAPMVNDMRSNPGAAGGQAAMQRPQALPRAGFMPYSSSIPAFSTSLPQVVNGVPKPMPAPKPAVNPKLGKAGKYKAPKATAPAGPVTAKTYAPYKGYGGAPTASAAPPSSGGGGLSSSQHVSGSLLHWSRTGH